MKKQAYNLFQTYTVILCGITQIWHRKFGMFAIWHLNGQKNAKKLNFQIVTSMFAVQMNEPFVDF